MKKLDYNIAAVDEGRVDALVARLIGFSRARVRGLVDHGGVWVNGDLVANPGLAVVRGDRLSLAFDPERRYREKPPQRATRGFSVVYCDEQLVVVSKDAGVLSVPTSREERNTLVDRLSAHLAKGRSDQRKVSVVHRLDRETSGLLVFGRTAADARAVIAQFAARKPEREYIALVAGCVALDEGRFESYLATDKALNQKSVAREKGGELAITHYAVTRRFPDATEVRVHLETGRRNQIRAHFAEAGHPVLGDQRYRPELAVHRKWPFTRLALHARVLGFRHPGSGKALRFEAAVPAEFRF